MFRRMIIINLLIKKMYIKEVNWVNYGCINGFTGYFNYIQLVD